MENKETKPTLKEPNATYGGKYSYTDYLNWEIEEMVEIIKGKVFKWTAAPSRIHQKVVVKLSNSIYTFLEGKPCEIYTAPFDVRLAMNSEKNEEIFTVVQPDLCVICDKAKLDDAGCLGAPDLITEVLSPGNNKKDLQIKYEVYAENGVPEYWIIHPIEQTLLIYSLKDGMYVPSRLYTSGDVVMSQVLHGLVIDLEALFKEMD